MPSRRTLPAVWDGLASHDPRDRSAAREESAALRSKDPESFDAPISSKLSTLSAAGFEVAAHVGAAFVDGARMWMVGRAVKDTTTMLTHLESLIAEMSRLEAFDDIQLVTRLPPFDIGFGDKNGSRALVAARATSETVQFGNGFRHQGSLEAG